MNVVVIVSSVPVSVLAAALPPAVPTFEIELLFRCAMTEAGQQPGGHSNNTIKWLFKLFYRK